MTTPNTETQKLSDEEAANAKYGKRMDDISVIQRAAFIEGIAHARQQSAPGEMILAITDGPIVSENITIDQRYAFQKEIATLKAERDGLAAAVSFVLDTHERLGPNQSDELRRPEIMGRLRAALKGEKEPAHGK